MPYKDPQKRREGELARYYANRERILAERRERYASDPEYREKVLNQAKESTKRWAKANPEKRKEISRRYRERHPETVKQREAEWRRRNPEYRKMHYRNNRERQLALSKKWREDNPEKVQMIRARTMAKRSPDEWKEYQREWRKKNPGKAGQYAAKYAKNNPDRSREQQRKYRAKRMKADIGFRIETYARTRSRALLRGKRLRDSVSLSLRKAFGCTIRDLRKHIEAQWEPGMNWGNWSRKGWHIDHIRPLASFDLTDPEQFAAAWHKSNLRPLWAEDNLAKGAKWDEEAA